LIGNVVQYDSDISAYTVEKTMDMENRIKAMRELHAATRKPSLRKASLQVNAYRCFFIVRKSTHRVYRLNYCI